MELPPFYIGQEVVAIVDGPDGAFKKGATFIIRNILKGHCSYVVNIGIKTRSQQSSRKCVCKECKARYDLPAIGDYWHFSSNRFASKEQFKQVTYTKILEQEPIAVN